MSTITESGAIMLDTPEDIAFFRALAIKGMLGGVTGGRQRAAAIAAARRIYGYSGTNQQVIDMHYEYVEGTQYLRGLDPEYMKRIVAIAQEALDRAEEEAPGDPMNKDRADANVQAEFECGGITEQEGNDACLLIFVAVVAAYAKGH